MSAYGNKYRSICDVCITITVSSKYIINKNENFDCINKSLNIKC